MSRIKGFVYWLEDTGKLEWIEGQGYVTTDPTVPDAMEYAKEYMKTKQYADEHRQAFGGDDIK